MTCSPVVYVVHCEDKPEQGLREMSYSGQAIPSSSLVVSLLAAFIAMSGEPSRNRYAQFETLGSAIDCIRHRQRKMNG